MKTRAVSTPNIALIKYWGNRNDEYRLPAADSLSMTLDGPSVEVGAESAESFSARSFEPDGSERTLTEQELSRLEKHFLLCKKYMSGLPSSVSIEIRSQIPRGIGMASSSAVFSALAESYAGFVPNTSRKDVSILARLGSGSASRSVFGGFSAMVAGHGDEIDSSYAEEIARSDQWELYDVILAPSIEEKKTGSTEGHALAQTSPLFEKRLRELPDRYQMCVEAIREKNFLKLRIAAEVDCMDMHALMQSSTPPLNYLSPETNRITREIEELRAHDNLPVLYTMDAGPTVHLICEKSALEKVREYARRQKDCIVFETKIGGGSRVL